MKKILFSMLVVAFALQVNAQTVTLGNVTYNSQIVPRFCLTSSNNFVQVHQQFTLAGVIGHVTIEYLNVNGLAGSQQFFSDGTVDLFIANVDFNGSGTHDPDKVSGEYTYTIKDQNGAVINTLSDDVNVGDGVLQDVVTTLPYTNCNGSVSCSITPQLLYPNLIYNVDWHNNGVMVSNGQIVTSYLPFTDAIITDVGGCVDSLNRVGIPTNPVIPILNVPQSNIVEVNTIVQVINICGGLQYQLQRKTGFNNWQNMAGTTQKGTYRMQARNAVNTTSNSANFYVRPKHTHCGLKTTKTYDAVQPPPNCSYTLYDNAGRMVFTGNEDDYDSMLQNTKSGAYSLVVYDKGSGSVFYNKQISIQK